MLGLGYYIVHNWQMNNEVILWGFLFYLSRYGTLKTMKTITFFKYFYFGSSILMNPDDTITFKFMKAITFKIKHFYFGSLIYISQRLRERHDWERMAFWHTDTTFRKIEDSICLGWYTFLIPFCKATLYFRKFWCVFFFPLRVKE